MNFSILISIQLKWNQSLHILHCTILPPSSRFHTHIGTRVVMYYEQVPCSRQQQTIIKSSQQLLVELALHSYVGHCVHWTYQRIISRVHKERVSSSRYSLYKHHESSSKKCSFDHIFTLRVILMMQGSPWQYRQLDTLSFIYIMNSWSYMDMAIRSITLYTWDCTRSQVYR